MYFMIYDRKTAAERVFNPAADGIFVEAVLCERHVCYYTTQCQKGNRVFDIFRGQCPLSHVNRLRFT